MTVKYTHISYHAFVSVIMGVENQRAERSVDITRRRWNFLRNRFQYQFNVQTGFCADGNNLILGYTLQDI